MGGSLGAAPEFGETGRTARRRCHNAGYTAESVNVVEAEATGIGCTDTPTLSALEPNNANKKLK